VYGTTHIPTGKAIIAPNHTSFIDPPVVGLSFPEEIYFIARKTLFSSPLFAALIRKLNAYPVGGTAQDLGTFKLICRLLNENKKVVLFPEGHRSYDGSLSPIQSGICMLSMRCQAPIIPIYIHGCYDIWNRTHKYPKLTGKTACIIGSPIIPDKFSHLGKKEAQEAMGQSVKEALIALKDWYENGAQGNTP
jgi:1-acyl-sn-glycerol-3-phosphate acyltransferase